AGRGLTADADRILRCVQPPEAVEYPGAERGHGGQPTFLPGGLENVARCAELPPGCRQVAGEQLQRAAPERESGEIDWPAEFLQHRAGVGQELPPLLEAALHSVETDNRPDRPRLEPAVAADVFEHGLDARQADGERGRPPEEARREQVERLRCAPAIPGAARVLGHVLERGLDALPGAPEVLAHPDERPGGSECSVVPERFQLPNGLTAEIQRLVRREGSVGRGAEATELAQGPELHDAIAARAGELHRLFSPGVRTVKVSAVLVRGSEIEQQLDAFWAGRLDESGRPPRQLGRRVPVVDRERAPAGGP